ncbi:MAG: hypothetical protein FWG68_11740 [Defluviitaleaceae bacterium]|nr:hypothetical protein [Defluviitaleaceae bacterium]
MKHWGLDGRPYGWHRCRGDRPRSPVCPSDFSLSIRRWTVARPIWFTIFQ